MDRQIDSDAEAQRLLEERRAGNRRRSKESYYRRKTTITCEICGKQMVSHSMRLHVNSRRHQLALKAAEKECFKVGEKNTIVYDRECN